jgi:hypothetical protein
VSGYGPSCLKLSVFYRSATENSTYGKIGDRELKFVETERLNASYRAEDLCNMIHVRDKQRISKFTFYSGNMWNYGARPLKKKENSTRL